MEMYEDNRKRFHESPGGYTDRLSDEPESADLIFH